MTDNLFEAISSPISKTAIFAATSSPISKTAMEKSLDPAVLGQLHTPEAKELHSLMKELGRIGVGQIIDLPQIVVLGGQNAGKSSTLEAISGINFPVKQGLCTRFATELELESDTVAGMHASIKYSDNGKIEIKPLDDASVDKNGLPDIIERAAANMKERSPSKQFYNDVLILNVKVPGLFPLLLVDLPGVFEVGTNDQPEEDIQIVNELVDSYLERPNTIIMLVVGAEFDFVHQKVLKTVKKFNDYQNRTIGIITKPDVSESRGYQKEYIRLAQNKQVNYNLKLGWHVLRNRDTLQNETSFAQRNAAENRLFTKHSTEISWSAIKDGDWGVKSLREKLSKIQFEHQRNCLPDVTQEIRVKLAERQEQLDRTGPARPEPEDVREFLRGRAIEFHMLAKSAVEGRYNAPFFRRLPDPYKLRAQIFRFNAAFDYTMRANGAKEIIVGRSDVTVDGPKLRQNLKDFFEIHPYPFDSPKKREFASVCAELNKHAASHRGRELPGFINGALAFELFQEQSSKWEQIARHHIDLVTAYSKDFVKKALEFLIGPADSNQTTAALLRSIVFEFFKEREQVLQAKLEELIQPYKNGFALPADEEFEEYMDKRATDTKERIQKQIQAKQSVATDGSITISKSQLGSIVSQALDGAERVYSPGTIVDRMQVYYELSRRTFTDNIINLALEGCLICHIDSILTPEKVRKMSNETVMEIAAESESTRAEREALTKQKEILQRALDFCTRRELFNVVAQEKDFSSTEPGKIAPKPATSAPEANSDSALADNKETDAAKPSINSTTPTPEVASEKTESSKQPNPTLPESIHSQEALSSSPGSKPISPSKSAGSSATAN